jgi:hypothetical protein
MDNVSAEKIMKIALYWIIENENKATYFNPG